ncbi:Protein of unknown function, partial [Gryllus bimaculatus]
RSGRESARRGLGAGSGSPYTRPLLFAGENSSGSGSDDEADGDPAAPFALTATALVDGEPECAETDADADVIMGGCSDDEANAAAPRAKEALAATSRLLRRQRRQDAENNNGG